VARCVHCDEDVVKRKDARNMLRNNWLLINHYMLHIVGLTFVYLQKMHGHPNIKSSTCSETERSSSGRQFYIQLWCGTFYMHQYEWSSR
jgi:hypothetical protein